MLSTMLLALRLVLSTVDTAAVDECGNQDIAWPADPATDALRAELGAGDDGSDITL